MMCRWGWPGTMLGRNHFPQKAHFPHHSTSGSLAPLQPCQSSTGIPGLQYLRGGANVLIIEIKCTINVMHLNHPETIPPPHHLPWKNCLPRNCFLVPKRLETAAVSHQFVSSAPERDPSMASARAAVYWLNWATGYTGQQDIEG